MTRDDEPDTGAPQPVVRAGSNLGYVAYGTPQVPPGFDRASAVRPSPGGPVRAGTPGGVHDRTDPPARSVPGVVITSLVVPGWGHLLVGRTTSAVVLLLAAVVGATAGAAVSPPGVHTGLAVWCVVALVAALTAGRIARRTAQTHRALEQRGL